MNKKGLLVVVGYVTFLFLLSVLLVLGLAEEKKKNETSPQTGKRSVVAAKPAAFTNDSRFVVMDQKIKLIEAELDRLMKAYGQNNSVRERIQKINFAFQRAANDCYECANIALKDPKNVCVAESGKGLDEVVEKINRLSAEVEIGKKMPEQKKTTSADEGTDSLERSKGEEKIPSPFLFWCYNMII